MDSGNRVKRKRIGELLCEKAYLDEAGLGVALAEQKVTHRRLGQILLELGYITQSQLNEALAVQVGIEKIDLSEVSIGSEVISLVPAELVSKYNILPLWRQNGRLAVAMVDPFQPQAMEDLRLVTGCLVQRYYAEPIQLEHAVLRFYGSNVARMLDDLAPAEHRSEEQGGSGDFSPAKLHELAREPSLVNLVNLIILEAIEARASDIHIEPFEHEVKIKYRIDGILVEKTPSSKRLHAAIVSRIKIMGDMNIAERFIPQDGHIEFMGNTGKIDIRVSTVPTVFGEAVELRLLDRTASLIDLCDLGMNPQTLNGFAKCLKKTHGIVLVTGPTGSGKTTTLYAALNKIYSPGVKMITIEDPVEYQLDGINQMPVNVKRGLTFATGLRHILRHDPDIIMVGEIRDRETADIAIRAALTGHLVFSTLHTNDAAGAVTRLIDMGVEPFLLASSLEGILAQRLVREVCPKCKEPYHPDENLLKNLGISAQAEPPVQFYHGAGCEECSQTGMSGRIGIFELLRITNRLRELIATRPTTEQIAREAPADHISMVHDGIGKVMQGLTTPEEVFRVAKSITEDD
ncbi:MAG: ATPase, T2SS/T4P/T4SS family [Sedimentisphaerales bacterium]|jgi:type II secretory ATPase GspE/PulE/Tfp pilus assembly ATPase PilB-like protein|nr:ATPase, T2SS/T4P/T4SS family [Sedimentisphaerales bacterium]NLZ06606.1 Flp pilus assembly complex ATPase component TadA [Phycisphaerae bacterium]HNY79248.1 ATPase, T2SS/T4P/T4SS family [Sedimentisphaerales bacterium]HOC61536.1 ATPase, T2SS/T4P/T4SS family [Sedimentisphaerales bacterium]HOH65200.1 ATPase, T2SS/T4P/T4SS family [Sedimentisphaerales bacterium]